jgi:hypothetical protein
MNSSGPEQEFQRAGTEVPDRAPESVRAIAKGDYYHFHNR